jgi:hypothetical protein
MSHAERAAVRCSKLAPDTGSFQVGVELMRYWDDARRGPGGGRKEKGSFIHSHT